ncbi:TPA: hypothetical protein EYO12_03290 [Candidatus Saccharibacteria bacterium]|nr:hypothetical protein [Candidatus Saccharibacteria bacterium]HIO87942.1 hypothetical protein [Candidatus Saccharibacteria bacterium]
MNKDVALDSLEVVIDNSIVNRITESEAIKELPQIQLVLASYRVLSSYRDKRLLEKILVLLNKTSSHQKELFEIFAKTHNQNLLLDYLDQAEDEYKVKVTGSIFNNWVTEKHDQNILMRCLEILQNLSPVEIRQIISNDTFGRYLGEKLCLLGICTRNSRVGQWDGGDQVDFPLTNFGKTFINLSKNYTE